MGRNVKIRASYDHDARFLMRIKEAVEKDNSRPVDWRSELMTALQEAIQLMISAPPAGGG